MKTFMKINENDNVAVALKELAAGTKIAIESGCSKSSGIAAGSGIQDDARTPDADEILVLRDNIPQGHKFALATIPAGSDIIKYGCPIGKAKLDILPGSHIHTHNLTTSLNCDTRYSYAKDAACRRSLENALDVISSQGLPSTFSGFVRANGSVGIRNEIWIVPTVGCVNDVANELMTEAKEKFASRVGSCCAENGIESSNHFKSIDDIVAFRHPYGCSQLGDDQENTRKIIADLCMHPNAGGVLLLGLGCENSGIAEIKKYLNRDEKEIKYLVCQDVADEIETGLKLIEELIESAASVERTPCDISTLTVGVKCGGSDGLSGITANPLVGRFTDLLTAAGGSVLMSEVPEMFGAENVLFGRCKDQGIFEQGVEMIQNFKDYFSAHGQPVYENPSPGNKAGGITTLEEKSLGCVQKAGCAEIKDILEYAQMKRTSGLSLVSAPGNDLVSSTALAAAGAQLILFTTGRGTPFSAPVPTLKISSNSRLYSAKEKWIDFDAGVLTEGSSLAELSTELFRFVIDTANGKPLKSEKSGYRDMAIFKQNVTL